MKHKFITIFLIFFTIIFCASMRNVFALEQEIIVSEDDTLTAYKETVKDNNVVGEYSVQISVPGKDGVLKHNEVILMVDGSYSMDEEWPQMKEVIMEIGRSFLNGTGNTQLTLMAFGMGDNIVLQHIKSTDELALALGELPGTLLYGRSSTNCEAGFTGVIQYIQNHDETLNNAHVIFISDGNVNTDETPHVFYNWKQNTWLRKTPAVLAAMSLEYDLLNISNGGNASEAFITVFGEDADISIIMETVTDEQLITYLDIVWDNVYENSGLDKEGEYPVSVVERAFVDYDNKYGTHIQEAFYYTLWGRSYPNRWQRTPAAAERLAGMEQVKSLYLVDYDSYSSWMDTGITSSKSKFIQSNGISGLLDAIKDITTELSKTSYSNSVIVDYTSKWVNPMDTNEDGIFDEKDITVVYNGEVLEDANVTVLNITTLTEEELLELSIEEQEKIQELLANNEDIIGNTNNCIYRIKWNVHEGMLKSSDRYVLSYKVKVDTNELGYEGSIDDYKANADIELKYDEEKTNTEVETITKPGVVVKEDPVIQRENIIIITKTDQDGNLLTGSDFDVYSEDIVNNTNIIKEYSVDGIVWNVYDKETFVYDAVYFRFRGLYDNKYILSEIKTPKGYKGISNKVYDFTNQEGKVVEETIVNEAIIGTVKVHYVVKSNDKYIPFSEFAYDEDGNLLTIFEGKNIDVVTLTGKVDGEFYTNYENIEALTLSGLYYGNMTSDSDNLIQIEKNYYTGTFTEEVQEFTYVYELNVGTGEEEYPMPPQTGSDLKPIRIYITIMSIILLITKILLLKNRKYNN